MSKITGKAMVATGLNVPWELREYPVPDPEPDCIVIKISMSSICGSDIHTYRGEYKGRTDILGSKEKPKILGHEMMGRIYKLGSNVKTDFSGQTLKEGDRVVWCYFKPCGKCPACINEVSPCPDRLKEFTGSCDEFPHFNGAFAEYYYLRPNQWIYKVPDTLPDEAVVYVNCAGSTVAYGLQKVDLPLGAQVVIQGAGGLGIIAAPMVKDMGAARAIVIDKLPQRLDLAKAFGADNTINIDEYPTPEARIEKVKELTGGKGAELTIEVASAPDAVSEGVQMLAPGGTYLSMGLVTGGLYSKLDVAMLVHRGLKLVGSANYRVGTIPRVLDFMERNRDKYPFEKMISHKFKLEDIEESFRQIIAGGVLRAAITMD
jgi:L-iditol 2-dehydrogenase